MICVLGCGAVAAGEKDPFARAEHAFQTSDFAIRGRNTEISNRLVRKDDWEEMRGLARCGRSLRLGRGDTQLVTWRRILVVIY
jgi:hypothetical protein